MQVVRDFLVYGPIYIKDKKYGNLCQYYFEVAKSTQQGHHCNLQVLSVSQAIRSPILLFNGLLLNQQQAVVCDVVHWGLTDYLRKRLAVDRNRDTQVCSP
jgi:hypothetical protein